MWRYRVGRLQVADLGDAGRLAQVGLGMPLPGRKTWPPFQEVGETLWREGWPGLVAPSAARPSGLVLCLFVTDPHDLPAVPAPPPTVVAEPPAPPTGLHT